MKTDFILAVQRMVENGVPPQWRTLASSPAIPPKDPPARRPRRRLAPVQGVAVRQRLGELAWAIHWEPVPGAVSYELQTNPDPGRMTRWFERGLVPKASAQVTLTMPSQRAWLRIRALGDFGAGPWSDPILLSRGESMAGKAA